MSTRVYGASDDLIEFDGDLCGEVGCYGSGEEADPYSDVAHFRDGALHAWAAREAERVR